VQPRPDRILNYAEYPILYVDDEPENLRVFELSFKREFTILTAESGHQGLELLNTRPVALVLSDHKMPGMTGTEFLARACELDPKAIRVLVTAYGDAKTLSEAINSGSIYKFVPKPWRPEEMRMTLKRGIEAYALDRERDRLLRELTLLNQVSKSLTQELALEPLMELLLDTLTGDLGYDGASMLSFSATGATLSHTHFSEQDPALQSALGEIDFNDTNAARFLAAIRDGVVQQLSIDQVDSYEAPVRKWLTEIAAQEVLVLPLLGKQVPIGALAIDNRRGGTPFTGDDQTLLEGLMHQAVIAIGNARLVTDLRHSREQIRRADRLGMLGTLAAGLAHEINNPLVSIHTFLSLAPEKRQSQDEEFWGDYHALACREVDRIRRLVETMRSLGRDTSNSPREPLAAAELATEVVRLVQREATRANVTIHCESDPETPKLVAVRDHMHQVFLNLLLNALHATPSGGEVTLHTGPAPDGTGVRIAVSDTGAGIPEEQLSQIFDPFFTTKDASEGTGLGLMICHRIVTAHDGTIEVQSAEGQGSTFCVTLPGGDDRGAPADAQPQD
jgi:signal transduction histidine kinase/FixJ family two-component response regulator